MKTFLGEDIKETTRGLLYLCEYNYKHKTIEIRREIQFKTNIGALNAYASIPNPESQVAIGNSYEDFIKEVNDLHDRLNNREWVEQLSDYL